MELVQSVKKHFNPTEDQILALKSMDAFLNSDNKIFLFKGYAGTGKTTLVKYIIDYLQNVGKSVQLMAPTGRAAKILSEKTGFKASTIHKKIYNLKQLEEEKYKEKGRLKYRFRYALKEPDENQSMVYFIDEASLISNMYAEGEFFIFGSGRLLSDLVSFTQITNEKSRKKVVFIGDPAQLPPVGDAISRALDKKELEKEFALKTQEYTLTNIVRQAEESGILNAASYVRQVLNNPERKEFQLPDAQADLNYIAMDEVVDNFVKNYDSENINSSIIVNYSNASAFGYNEAVREKLFPGNRALAVGDILIIQQNNYNYEVELMNGTLVKVLEVGPLEIKSNLLSYKSNGEKVRVQHKFRTIKLEVNEFGKSYKIQCLILENLLFSPEANLSYEENIALYLDFKIRNKSLKPKTPEFADALRNDAYFNALKVKFGYAITCHKAQGGEWNNVFVNMDVAQSVLSDMYLRWAYTAFTRAENNLFLFNTPYVSQFSKFDYKPLLIENEERKTVESVDSKEENKEFILPENIEEIENKFNVNQAEDFIKNKFYEILGHIDNKKEIQLKQRKPNAFQEEYVFERKGTLAGVLLNYNGKNQFTKIRPRPGKIFDKEFSKEMVSILAKPISILKNNSTRKGQSSLDNSDEEILKKEHVKFSGDANLKALYDLLGSLLKDTDVFISNIEHGNFFELYTFTKGEDVACIQFFYNGMYQFTKAKAIINKCNSNSLLELLNEKISTIK